MLRNRRPTSPEGSPGGQPRTRDTMGGTKTEEKPPWPPRCLNIEDLGQAIGAGYQSSPWGTRGARVSAHRLGLTVRPGEIPGTRGGKRTGPRCVSGPSAPTPGPGGARGRAQELGPKNICFNRGLFAARRKRCNGLSCQRGAFGCPSASSVPFRQGGLFPSWPGGCHTAGGKILRQHHWVLLVRCKIKPGVFGDVTPPDHSALWRPPT